jgi:hypothetical protein
LNLECTPSPNQLIWIIYTSWTGDPYCGDNNVFLREMTNSCVVCLPSLQGLSFIQQKKGRAWDSMKSLLACTNQQIRHLVSSSLYYTKAALGVCLLCSQSIQKIHDSSSLLVLLQLFDSLFTSSIHM